VPKLAEAFAVNLRRLRKARDLSQEELAKSLKPEVSRQTIFLWEKGEGGLTSDSLRKVAEYFGVEETDLVSTASLPSTLAGAWKLLTLHLINEKALPVEYYTALKVLEAKPHQLEAVQAVLRATDSASAKKTS
jgi:transcriptional regulator with XRE-family HTH domain